jgi:hypothetical protein
VDADIELGPLQTKYQGRPLGRRDLLFVILPGILVVLALLAYGVYRASYGYAHFGPLAASVWSRPWLLLASLATLALLVLALIRLYLAHRFIAIHENGLHVHLSPLRDYRLPWSHISGIASAHIQDHFFGVPLRTSYHLAIYPTLSKVIRLDQSIGNITDLTEEITSRIEPDLQSQLQSDFESGKWVYFNEIAIQKSGLRISGRFLPWNHITYLSVETGHLVVKSDQFKTMRFPVIKTPNLRLFFQLLDNQGSVQKPPVKAKS